MYIHVCIYIYNVSTIPGLDFHIPHLPPASLLGGLRHTALGCFTCTRSRLLITQTAFGAQGYIGLHRVMKG